MPTSSSPIPHDTPSRRVLPPLCGKTVRASTACGADCQSREGRRDEVACLVCERGERVWDGGVEREEGEGEEEQYCKTDGIFLGEEEELILECGRMSLGRRQCDGGGNAWRSRPTLKLSATVVQVQARQLHYQPSIVSSFTALKGVNSLQYHNADSRIPRVPCEKAPSSSDL